MSIQDIIAISTATLGTLAILSTIISTVVNHKKNDLTLKMATKDERLSLLSERLSAALAENVKFKSEYAELTEKHSRCESEFAQLEADHLELERAHLYLTTRNELSNDRLREYGEFWAHEQNQSNVMSSTSCMIGLLSKNTVAARVMDKKRNVNKDS